MAKLLKLRISKAVSSSFHSCRSKDPCTLPQHPTPSFFPNTELITLDLLSEKIIHRNNESLLISTPVTTGNRCSSRNGEAYTSDDSRTSRSPSYEFNSDDDIKEQPRSKIPYSCISEDKILAKKNKGRSSRKKKNITTNKTRLVMMMSETNWDHDNIHITHEDEEEEEEALVSSSSCKSYVEFSNDSSSNTTTSRPKKTTKRRVKNTRGIVNKNGGRSSISTSTTSSDGELPARLSELIPCNVEGKVKESFAIVKKSEDPYEDFKSSMMEMILEKKMFEKNDLEQLLQCFLSLNAKNYHGLIVEAFSEIWNTLFSPNHSLG